MRIQKLSFALVGLALTPLAVIGYQYGSAVSAGQSGEVSGRRLSEGERRIHILERLTEEYVSAGNNVTPAMRVGKELAPIVFLNQKLKREGRSFRVRSTDGMTAETFLVTA